uniref:tRNA dimethylallyltransferase n=1 Tax=Ciona savignyi TaxID=51511 RepID=H2YDP6_CIOSA
MRSILKFVWNMFSNPKKLVVVLGATGAGKSKLALDIATRCHGEIISVDSMQVYKGLDIVTNKVSKEELEMCRHHMIGFLDPRNEFTIVDFQEQTLKLIDEIQSRKKIPILVGGTNYYVQSILWDLLLKTKCNSQFSEENETERKEMWETESSVLHKMLMEVDPASAKVIHPKDKRKIVRALEVFKQTGKLQSNLIEEQRRQTGGGSLGGPLRFPGACLLWVQSEPDVLRERIYKRVEKMIDQGLLKELKDFHEDFNKERLAKGLEPDYEHGIFQSIGFKEFHDYLTADATTEEKMKEKMLEEATEQMKLATWQYAKYQMKFIRKRIVNRSNALPVYPLDATDPTLWEENVLYPSLKVLTSCDVFDFGNAVPQQTKVVEPLAKSTESDSDGKTLHTCNLCGGLTMTKNNWEGHLQSKRHKNNFGKWKKSLSDTSAILETRRQQLTTVDPNGQTE